MSRNYKFHKPEVLNFVSFAVVELERRVPSFWFDINTKTPQATISRLKPGHLYEYRVGGHCPTNRYEADPAYTYGAIGKFTLDKDLGNDDTTVLTEEPEPPTITNEDPIDSLKVGDIFTAYDYEVEITELDNPAGNCLTGEGATNLRTPGIDNERIKVAYNCIKINTDKRLFEGKVASTYTPDWKNIKDSSYGGISDSIGKPNGSGTITNPIKLKDKDGTDLVIDDIRVNENGQVVVITEGGKPKPIKDFLGKDGLTSNGTTYIEATDSQGNTTKYQINTSPSGGNNLTQTTTTVTEVEAESEEDLEEIWRINKKFIDNRKVLGNEFYLSHDPTSLKGFYKREIEYLTKPISQGGLGGKIIKQENNLWKVIF